MYTDRSERSPSSWLLCLWEANRPTADFQVKWLKTCYWWKRSKRKHFCLVFCLSRVQCITQCFATIDWFYRLKPVNVENYNLQVNANDCSVHLAKHKHLLQLYIGWKHTIVTQGWKWLWSWNYHTLKLKRWRCKQSLIKVKLSQRKKVEEITAPKLSRIRPHEPKCLESHRMLSWRREVICLR